jgi:restriction endonuclease Mrr
MIVAQFHEIFLPVLRRIADGRERTIAVRRVSIADDFGLADDERAGILTRRRTIA